jgi:hypothetical protein
LEVGRETERLGGGYEYEYEYENEGGDECEYENKGGASTSTSTRSTPALRSSPPLVRAFGVDRGRPARLVWVGRGA